MSAILVIQNGTAEYTLTLPGGNHESVSSIVSDAILEDGDKNTPVMARLCVIMIRMIAERFHEPRLVFGTPLSHVDIHTRWIVRLSRPERALLISVDFVEYEDRKPLITQIFTGTFRDWRRHQQSIMENVFHGIRDK